MNDSALALPAALGVAAAAGLDPFLTLLLFAVAPLGGWLPPEAMHSVADPLVVAVAAGLFMMEILIERARALAAFWHLSQSVARPVAAALFAHLIVSEVTDEPLIQVVAPITAAAVAMLVHLAKCGWSTLSWFDGDRHVRPTLIALLEDACVAALVVLALDAPRVSGALALVGLGVLFTWGRPIMRAGVFSHTLAWQRSWGSLMPFRWITVGELPADLASKVATIPHSLGQSLKVARVGGFRLPGTGLFRVGWLVVGAAEPWWVARTLRGPRVSPLDVSGEGTERLESLFLQVGGSGAAGEPSLILARSGPSSEALYAEVSRGMENGEPALETGVDGPSLS